MAEVSLGPTDIQSVGLSSSYDIDNMDVDFDIDGEGDSREIVGSSGQTYVSGVHITDALWQNLQQVQGEGELEGGMEGDVVPNKVHIYLTVDTLDSVAVKRFVAEHEALTSFSHIEWINDAEANLVYNDNDSATRALYALTLSGELKPEEIPVMDDRPAKGFSGAQGVQMAVRMARATDVKKKGAADESRFYLLNPEKDPRERQRRRELAMKRRRDWDGEACNYNRNRFDDRENKRRRGEERWEASMYDDNENTDMVLEEQEDGTERRKRVRFGGRRNDELFAQSSREGGRLRGRSASPPHDGDGRYGFGTDDDDASAMRRKIRQRSQTPPALRSNGFNPNVGKELFANNSSLPKPNAGKELFARPLSRDTNPNVGKELFARPLSRDTNPNAGKELFSTPLFRNSNPNAGKELFGEKLSSLPNQRGSFSGDDLTIAGASLRRRGSSHRRTDAIDASPRMSNSATSLSPELKPRLSLADRITAGRSVGRRIDGTGGTPSLAARITREDAGTTGTLADRVTSPDGGGFKVKGEAGLAVKGQAGFPIKGEAGLSIKGAATDANNPNAGKEIFARVSRRSMLSS